MTKSLKSLLLSLLLVVTAASGIAGVSAVAKADTAVPEITQSDIYMKNGASIRAEKTDDAGYGIRFMGTIKESAYQALVTAYGEDNVECGILICPKSYLVSGVTLDFDETDNLKHYVDGVTTIESGVKYFQSRKATDLTLSSDETTRSFRCSLVDIKATNLDREFAAAAYVGYRADSESAFTYVVSAPTSRNIYTVATYALNDETASLSDDATSYLNNDVVAEVNKTYTQTNVELVSEAEGADQKLFATGENFTLNATVQTADGSKSLEAGVSLESDSGASKVSGNTFTVTDRGDLNLNVNFKGFSSANTSLSGYTCDTKTIAVGELRERTDIGDKTYTGEGTEITVESEGRKLFISNAAEAPAHPEGKAVYKFDRNCVKYIAFADDDIATLKSGDYIVFDVYGDDSPSIGAYWFYDNGTSSSGTLYDTTGKSSTYSIAGFADCSTYNIDGTPAEKPMHNDAFDSKWVRIQVKLNFEGDISFTKLGLYIYANQWHDVYNKNIYFANIQFRSYSEGYTSDVSLGDFDTEATHAFGEEVALTVKAKTNRGTYKNVNAACTITSGNGSVADNKFIVGLGDSTLQFTFGDITKDVTVKGADHIDLTNGVVAKVDGNAIITKEDSYTDSKNNSRTNVLKYTISDDVSFSSFDQTQYGANFSKDVAQYMKKGMYLYFDVCFSQKTTLFLTSGGNDSYLHLYTYANNSDGTPRFQMYKNGKIIDPDEKEWNGKNVNEWVTVEYKLNNNWYSDGKYFYFGYTPSDYATNSPIYYANVEYRETPKDYSVIDLTVGNEALDLTKYAAAQNEAHTTLQKVTTTGIAAVDSVAQTSTVWKWNYSDSIIAAEGTGYDSNLGGVLLPGRVLKAGSYLYFDVYVTSYSSLCIFAQNSSEKNLYCLIYSACNSGGLSDQTNGWEYQIYDTAGNAYTTGTFNGGSFNGKWVTVEFKLVKDWSDQSTISLWNYKGDNPIYLSNIKISQTKLMGVTAE